MLIPLFLLLQAVPPAAGPQAPAPAEDACVAIMKLPAADAAPAADRLARLRGDAVARQCLGLARANRGEWAAAAADFAAAAAQAKPDDARAPTYWAQAGNAWLAAGEPAKALPALTNALADPALTGFERGEAELDRSRALAQTGDRAGARGAIDKALVLAADDPLAWLLSATLARQSADLPRARADIGQAVRRAADDPAVQLEAGNIAAAGGDEAGAKAAWAQVVRLRPDSPQAKAAEVALAQFD